jgi:hypothetical protein
LRTTPVKILQIKALAFYLTLSYFSLMQKLLKKLFAGALSAWVILAMLVFAPPFSEITTALVQTNANDPTLPDCIGEFGALEVIPNHFGIITQAVKEAVLSPRDRILSRDCTMVARAMLLRDLRISVELDNYCLQNNLHFNTPLIAYRQPVSDHASENDAMIA